MALLPEEDEKKAYGVCAQNAAHCAFAFAVVVVERASERHIRLSLSLPLMPDPFLPRCLFLLLPFFLPSSYVNLLFQWGEHSNL